MNTDFAVAQVVASLHPRLGGPSRTVVHLSDALANHPGVQVKLITQSLKGGLTVSSQGNAVDRRLCQSSSFLAIKFGLPAFRELEQLGRSNAVNLIHSHGVWLPVNHWAARTARRWDIPLIIHPRGMLEPWAMNNNALKKRVAMRLFQKMDLDTAKALVATSLEEYYNIRRMGLKQPVALIPNGVRIPLHRDIFYLSQVNKELRTALFISRIHPVKGLLNLVQAWARLRPQNWRLRIAGPDEGGHLQVVIAAARQYGIYDSIEYIGEVDGPQKALAYSSADFCVLPTFSENFGVVVAEALAHGVPVITTRGAPWADLETYGCGWWIDIGVEPLVIALREAMALTDTEREAMGVRGRNYVQRYDWDHIARETLAVYQWVIGGSPRPDCVRID